MTETSGFFLRTDAERLAWRRIDGDGPTVIWVGGWRSDMGGTKAEALADAARAGGWNYLRYDHFAHGDSSGDWRTATIGRWRADLIALIDESVEGPVVLVGSSMGGWVASLAAVARPERIQATVLIAPAADFAHRLMWPGLSEAARREIEAKGAHTVTDDFDGPYDLTRTFFQDARKWSLLDGPVAIAGPVRVLQGMLDEQVPWAHAMALVDRVESPDVVVSLIKDGDHRLSRPADLERLVRVVGDMR